MKTFEDRLKESVPSLVVFQHVGSQNAVDVKYLIDYLRKEYDGRANIISFDASYNGQAKVRYKIQEYPTYILFKEGQELMRESGLKTQAQLEDMIKRAL